MRNSGTVLHIFNAHDKIKKRLFVLMLTNNV